MLFYGAWELLQLECQTTSGKCRHFQRCLILCDSMKTADLLFVSETKHCQRHNGGLSSGYQSNFFWSYHKFSNKSWSDFIFKILTKQLLQDLNQISAAKYWLNFSFKISPELQLQNLDQTLCSKSGILDKKLILWPNLSFQICTKLSSTCF